MLLSPSRVHPTGISTDASNHVKRVKANSGGLVLNLMFHNKILHENMVFMFLGSPGFAI